MTKLTELEDGIKFVTLEHLKNDRWDEKIALIDETQVSFGFMKWNNDKTGIHDFHSYSLVGTYDLIEAAKVLLTK